MAARNLSSGSNSTENMPDQRDSDSDDEKYSPKKKFMLSSKTWVAVVAFHLSLFVFVWMRNLHFPTAKTKRSAGPGEFVEERARKYLRDITNIAPRTVGSIENEKLVVNYLLREFEQIKKRASDVHDFQVDLFTVSGTFTLGFIGGFNSVYENVNNILVKVSPKGRPTDNSLLVNCHYDSVAESPGEQYEARTKAEAKCSGHDHIELTSFPFCT